MTRKLEVLVNEKDLIGGWSEVYAGPDGQPRYRSNNGLVGTGTRITRVSDVADAPPDPPPDPDPAPDPTPEPDSLPGDPLELEFRIMADGTIEAVQARLIPYPYPQEGVFPRMYDMVVNGTTYTFSETEVGTNIARNHVFTVGIFTVTVGFWGFVQVNYSDADAASAPGEDEVVTLLTITSHRWSLEDGTRISAPKASKTVSIRGDTVAIDTTAPTVVSVSPSGTDVAQKAQVTATFSENVVAGTGNLYLYDTTAGAVHETIDVGDVSIVGNQLSFTPTIEQAESNGYSLRWDAGIVEDASGNAILANTGNTYAWTTAAAPASSGTWYENLFAMRDGAGLGPRVSSFTSAATWAAATTGVSNSGSTITVSGSNITATGIDFSGFKLVNSGSNNVFEDSIGDINANGAGGNGRQWSIGGLNPTVRYCRITNPAFRGGINAVGFQDATGNINYHHNDIRDAAGQDPWKAPTSSSNVIFYDTNMQKGVHLTSGAHIDMIDGRKAGPGSSFRRALIIGDKTATSVPSGTGTGYNNAIRQNPSDFSPAYVGVDLTFEECILVGHDDPGAQAFLLSIGGTSSTGIRFYDVLIDLRYHPNLCVSQMRVDDWYVRYYDHDASVAAGQIVGLTAPVAFPNLAAQPAAVPSTMAAPVIIATPGGLQWADNARPANQRALIDRYDLRYSTDGANWTTVSDVTLTSGSISVSAASNYRIQFRAHNSVGNGAWSSSSNLVTVAAPSGTHRIMMLYGQSEPESILINELAGAPAHPTLLADNKVKFVYHDPDAGDPRPMISKWLVQSDSSLTGSMIAFANALIEIGGPNDTWEIGWVTYTGKGWSEHFNNSSAQFPFQHSIDVKNALSGTPILQYQSWLSANRTLDLAYARAFENLWLGTDNGAPVSAPHGIKNKNNATTWTANNLMPQIFDPAVSIPVLGQHKFEVRQDDTTWHQPVGGAANTDYTSVNIHNCRASVNSFFAGSNYGPSKRGMELCSYLNGYASGSGWTDGVHPGKKSADGIHRWAKHLAYAMCEHLGLVNPQPEITSVTWAVGKVTISSSAGPITTVFADRSESGLDSSQTHYTDVMGFYINGQPATRVELNGGNIEVYYGDGSQNFINTDTIMFLPGGAAASLIVPEDYQNEVWKGVPCVDIGVPGDGLMNLRPMIDFMAQFPNTLVNTTR